LFARLSVFRDAWPEVVWQADAWLTAPDTSDHADMLKQDLGVELAGVTFSDPWVAGVTSKPVDSVRLTGRRLGWQG
jgi:hypothetical protein